MCLDFKCLQGGSLIFDKAENLMQRDIMLAERRHSMVFGQLAMAMLCSAVLRHGGGGASAQHSMANYHLGLFTKILVTRSLHQIIGTKILVPGHGGRFLVPQSW